MAKAAATVTDEIKPSEFDHNGREVLFIVPNNGPFETKCRDFLNKKFTGIEHPPAVLAEIKVQELATNTIVYVAHPVRVFTTDRKGKKKADLEIFVSRPIDVETECTNSPRRGAKILDYDKLASTITSVAKQENGGRFFCGHLSGFHKNDFSQATIQLLVH